MNIKQNKKSKHSYFMSLALLQAKKVIGNTKINPAVGCIIVKNDSVVGAAHTSFNGRPHAEHNAIINSKENVKNSDMYITLEPCSHYGKTPPCVKTIIKNKVRKVFFSLKDPDYRSFNKSTKQFKKKSIKVLNGILYKDTKNFYRSYFTYKDNKLPFVTAKMAISKDFYTKNKREKWITNNFSRGRVHLMRSNHDCIITSHKTVLDDNPNLNCRIPGLEDHSPCRIILDKNLKMPLKSNIVKSANKHRTIIFFNKIKSNKIDFLRKSKIMLVKFPLNSDGDFILENVLKKVKLLGFSRIFLETGLNLTTSFLKRKLINDFQLFVSKKNLGINGSKSFKKNMGLFLKNKMFIHEKVNLFGDKLISYRIK